MIQFLYTFKGMGRVALLLASVFGLIACDSSLLAEASSRYEGEIAAFERSDASNPPPSNAVLFLGSSSIRMWGPELADDMQPLTVIPRGFGGSTMADVLHYLDRIVLPYKPRAIVLYVGENDLVQGVSPKRFAESYVTFTKRVYATLPDCRIYFLSIKPTPNRMQVWQKMQEANALIAELAETDSRQTYVDVATDMLDERGQPKAEIFLGDGIHMNNRGYAIWNKILKPVLVRSEGAFE